MSDNISDASIKVGIDATGVEVGLRKIEEGAAKTGKTLDSLGKGDGINKLGDGAEAAANKFVFGTKGIIDSIEKRTASMELGKRGTVEYYTALANQKGINPAILKPYLDQLDAVTRKTHEAAEAQRKADDGAKFVEGLRARAAEIGKSASELASMRAAQLGVADSAAPFIARLQEAEEAAGGLGGALGLTTGAVASFLAGLAGAVSIGGFVAVVDSAVSSLADLDDMAQKTGSSVETLSRLQKVAQATGQDFGAVDGAIAKLAKGMGGLDEDSNKVIGALKRLGISTKDIASQDPSEVLIKAATALQGYADGAGKTALINDLLSKSGADLLPYLNDVAEGIGQFSGSSAASATAASAFGDNLGVMKVRMGEMGNVIAANLLPFMVRFSESVKEIAESEKFKQFLEGTGTAISSFAGFVSEAYRVLVPAATVAAAYFATFVAAPAAIAVAGTALTALYGVVGSGAVALIASGGIWAGLNTTLYGTAVAANTAAGGFFTLKTAASVVIAAFAGWQIGTYLRENFVEARVAGLAFVGAMMTGWENLKYAATVAWEAVGFAWDKTINSMKLVFAEYLSGVAKGLATVGAEKTSAQVGAYVESLRAAAGAQKTFGERIAGTKAAHEAELRAIEANTTALVAYELNAGKAGDAAKKATAPIALPSLGGGGNPDAVNKMREAYASLTASIQERIAAASMEANGLTNLSESQKLQIALDAQLSSGKLKLKAEDLESYRASIARLAGQEAIIASNKRALAGTLDFARMQKEMDDQAAARLAGIAKEAEQNELLARTFGKTKLQIEEMTLARLEDQLAQRASNTLTLKEIEDLEAEITARKRNRDALRDIETKDTSKKTNDAMLSDWKRTVEKYDDVFRTGFADMLNSGKDGWKSFTKSLVTTFKTSVADQIYKMFAQPFVMRLVASVVGVTGGGNAVAGPAGEALGLGGGAGGIAGTIAAAKSAYAAISSGFSGISTAVADGVQGALYQSGMTSQIASNGAFAQGAGTVAGYAAGAAVGVFGGRAISNGYAVSGSGNGLVNVGTAVGAIFGGPIGAAIGGVIAGGINRLFGRKAREYGDSTLTGSFGADSFSGSTNTSWMEKGGLFRSTKRGTESVAVDGSAAAAFSQGYATIKSASADFASVLSLNADALKNRAQSLNIKLGKDQVENEKAVAEFFTNVGNQIALELVPSLASFSKQGEVASATLQRIAGDYAFLDVAMATIGKTFGAAGLSSVAARERLIDLVGGLDALGKGTAFFAQNFLTEAERIAPVAAQVTATLAGLGLSFVDTRDEFKQVVQGLDLTSTSGQATYAALMKVQEGFAQVFPAAEQANNALTERIDLQKEYDELTMTAAQHLAKQRAALAPNNRGLFDQIQGVKALKTAQDAARASLDAVTSRMRSFGDSARELGKGLLLGELSTLTPEQQYAEAKRQYEGTLVAAKGGDAGAQDRFASIATTFLEASQKINGGDSIYAADFAGVLKTSDELAKWSDAQIDVSKASLDALNAQVAALGQLNATMLVISEGVAGGTGALIPPPPRPFSDGPNYAGMGTANTVPLVAEIKALRESNERMAAELAGLRSDQKQQTGALIQSNAQVTLLAADRSVDGFDSAMTNKSWANRTGKVALD